MNKLIIIGASGHGKVVADIAITLKRYAEICFLDDDITKKDCIGLPVIGKCNSFQTWIDNAEFIVAVGNSMVREKLLQQLLSRGAKVATLIHPNAIIGRNVKIGYGTVVMAGAIINADTQIGNGVIVNTASSIDHDNVIEDYCHISVGVHLAGTVHVKRHTWIGIGAVVSNNITIGEEITIGAGAVVIKHIEEKGTYVGVPVRKI